MAKCKTVQTLAQWVSWVFEWLSDSVGKNTKHSPNPVQWARWVLRWWISAPEIQDKGNIGRDEYYTQSDPKWLQHSFSIYSIYSSGCPVCIQEIATVTQSEIHFLCICNQYFVKCHFVHQPVLHKVFLIGAKYLYDTRSPPASVQVFSDYHLNNLANREVFPVSFQ